MEWIPSLKNGDKLCCCFKTGTVAGRLTDAEAKAYFNRRTDTAPAERTPNCLWNHPCRMEFLCRLRAQ